ncbi:hypothetical protein ACO0QE_001270 [Hanseniaspora vineae]
MSIKPLDPDVVNKIAAGEIIISPTNALKELIENSIDAGATKIDVTVQNNGFKLLQISDNGSGISKDDFPILCHRFTTSKISSFSDLSKIQSFGFRGEALSSISHIAHLSLITKRQDDKEGDIAWKGVYEMGELVPGSVKPSAGNQGTIISITDLFYNTPSRLKSLNQKEEYHKILDCLGKYSINNQSIGFTLKKADESKMALIIKSATPVIDRIRSIFGSSIANDLIEFEIKDIEKPVQELGFMSCKGLVSNLNYANNSNRKAAKPVFFINNRLIDCEPLKRAVYQIYANYLPRGAPRPFVYLSVFLKPDHIDVNVHPTKKEVGFLNEEEIVNFISDNLGELLSKQDSSRTFKANAPSTNTLSNIHVINPSQTPFGMSQGAQIKRDETRLVRIDSQQSKITSFLKAADVKYESQSYGLSQIEVIDEDEEGSLKTDTNDNSQSQHALPDKIVFNEEREKNDVNLTSIENLKEVVNLNAHSELTTILANLVYIGVIDSHKRLCAIQHDLKLFMIDYGAVCYELFYQIGLREFANFGKIHLSESLKIKDLLELLDILEADKITEIAQQLFEMKDMLDEYFSIEIDKVENSEEVVLNSVPMLLLNYSPSLNKLPYFIYRLGIKVSWDDEQECLDGVLKQIALLYVPEIVDANADEETIRALNDTLEKTVFPCIKKKMLI